MRIKIDAPNTYILRSQLEIRVSDLNYANHLSNDKLLTYAHQARVELFASWGFSELDFGGKGIIMTDAAVVFKSEGHLGDKITIDTGIADLSPIGFDLVYHLYKTQNQEDLAWIKTGIVCFDYSSRKVSKIPEIVLPFLTKK